MWAVKKNVFSAFLKLSKDGELRTEHGNRFHAAGPATTNARPPNFVLVRWTTRSPRADDQVRPSTQELAQSSDKYAYSVSKHEAVSKKCARTRTEPDTMKNQTEREPEPKCHHGNIIPVPSTKYPSRRTWTYSLKVLRTTTAPIHYHQGTRTQSTWLLSRL